MLHSRLIAVCAGCQIDALRVQESRHTCNFRRSCSSCTRDSVPACVMWMLVRAAYQLLDAPSLTQGQQAGVEV